MNKHRISTNIGKDQYINVELNQEFDLLEILSLKFTQKDIYTSYCADYGVVVGRISINNGLGIPNARVSIFIPLSTEDENDPVISALYPYKSVSDKNESGYRYNLLPARQQHGGHQPTGTFPDQTDVLNREEILEVYEKYYKYTVKTNDAGDFMIWGVPVGSHTLHIDIDLSDIGEYSLRPYDFLRQGVGKDKFKNTYSFKSSTDINELPQIISTDKTIDVQPFWGNKDLCELGITRTDYDLSDVGIYVEPMAYVLGSTFSDSGKSSVNKNCEVHANMGRKCNLISTQGKIEALRFTTHKDILDRPILEEYSIHEDIENDGSFVLPLPMNMDYKYTNEFGEIEYTNDPNKGVPTSACYRLRITIDNNHSGRARDVASYLVPNIREFNNSDTEQDKSYAWSTDWNDYPSLAIDNDNLIFNNVDGKYYPQDYFYRFTGNKVYSVSSFISSYFTKGTAGKDTFIGIKEIAPKDEDDCDNTVLTPPINWGMMNYNFSVLLAIVINTLEKILITALVGILQAIIVPFQTLYSIRIPLVGRPFKFVDKLIERLQIFGTFHLSLVTYPFCEKCEEPQVDYVIEDTGSAMSSQYPSVISGKAYLASTILNGSLITDNSKKQLLLTLPETSGNFLAPDYIANGYSLSDMVNVPTQYAMEIYVNGGYKLTGFFVNKESYTFYTNPEDYFIFTDNDGIITDNLDSYDYVIYDTSVHLENNAQTDQVYVTEQQQDECAKYTSVYNENDIKGRYPIYENNVKVGEELYAKGGNPCGICGTVGGYSQFKKGIFTIIPSGQIANWGTNFAAISEYSERKLVGKLFCGGIVNYSFIDNWLHGALYFFQFKAKVRWNNESKLDLNVARTKYCQDLVHYKVNDKRFYYKSTKTIDGHTFLHGNNNNIGYPTTFMDLGVRDEFISEITIDKNIDPNSSIIRNIGPTSYQNFKEMLELYIDLLLDKGNGKATYKDFFKNSGFNAYIETKFHNKIFNGDILQLISINNEAGIEEFDLTNRYYGAYQPNILDYELNKDLLSGGPIPINLVLDDNDGYRVRDSINNSSSNTINSSQYIPFYLWDKRGVGFGDVADRYNQSWNYPDIQKMKSQHMKYEYAFNTGDDYILYPMTKQYSGSTFTDASLNIVDIVADIESLKDEHIIYNQEPEGFTYLYITGGTTDVPISGILYTRVGDAGFWDAKDWSNTIDFIIKPTETNYIGEKQILSTPFLYYFGLKSGNSAVDKFINLFGPKNAFPSAE